MATVSFGDLYGSSIPGRSKGDVGATSKEKASGTPLASTENAPTFYWATFIILLIAVRFLWEYAG